MKINDSLLARLAHPRGDFDVVLDTDAYNEIDDQFAISYLLSCGRAHVRALYAAPFYAAMNRRSVSAADGMEKSYQEILRLLALSGREDMTPVVYRGSERFLPDEKTPVDSPAARDLARLAAQYAPDRPLYVAAIGAITNVASALLLAPAIRDNIVIVWLGGHAEHWPDTAEFNLMQDVAAARVVMRSGAAIVQLPCNGVTDALKTTKPELQCWLAGKGALNDYLCENTVREAESYAKGKPWSRVLWDISVIAWLLDGEGVMTRDELTPAPVPTADLHYSREEHGGVIRQVRAIRRDLVFEDLFRKLGCL